jgi:hypothetical protein
MLKICTRPDDAFYEAFTLAPMIRRRRTSLGRFDLWARQGHDSPMNAIPALDAAAARLANERLARLLSLAPSSAPEDLAAWPAEAWEAIAAVAARQGLSPLLYHRWVRQQSAPLPAALQERLRRQYYATAAANLRRFHALGQALAALHQAGLRAALLKGAHLAPLVYGDEGLRPMADLDLLVEDASVNAAVATLARLGYAPLAAEAWMADRYGHHALRDGSGLILELHERIGSCNLPTTIDHAALWARAEAVTIAGAPALALAPEDLLLHVCIHAGAQDLFQGGLRPLCDLAAILTHYRGRLDQGAAAARARQWGVARAVYLCLALARDLLGAPVAEEALRALLPGEGATALLAAARRLVLEEAVRAQGAPSPNLVALWGAPDGAARWRVLRRVLWPEPSHLRALLGISSEEPLHLGHYLRRWFGLATQRGRTLRLLAGRDAGPVDWDALVRWLAEE